MEKIENTLECIDALMNKMIQKGISSLSIKDNDFEIKLETQQFSQTVQMPVYSQVPSLNQPQSSAVSEPHTPVAPKGNIVKAPIIGTFYSAASPDDEPFVKIGQTVHKGDILFIVESMKIMNEVKSEFDGTVITINVKSGEAIEYDQPVMIIS